MNERQALLALVLSPGFGPVTLKRLLKEVKTPLEIFSLPKEKLNACGFKGDRSRLEEALLRARREEQALRRLGASYVTLYDEEYPPLLREIPDPPPVLFYQGRLPGTEPALAVVGSRAATSYGLTVTREWVSVFARAGLAVISGLALGIDRAAHESALRNGGLTFAVLGCGLDVNYPAPNAALRREMLEKGGGLLTEFPLGTRPKAGNFPIRNRLISGLSQAVLVVEASPKSGSLITARLAGEQGREVFAVPGPVYSLRSHGCHLLLRDGAQLADKPEDVLSYFGARVGRVPDEVQELTLGPEEAKVLEHLKREPLSVDELVYLTGLGIEEVVATLTSLEIEGLVERLPGNSYRRTLGR